MNDPIERFEQRMRDGFGSVSAPDQWDDIQQRAEAPDQSPDQHGSRPSARRWWGFAAVAAVATLVVGGIVAIGQRDTDDVGQTTPTDTIARPIDTDATVISASTISTSTSPAVSTTIVTVPATTVPATIPATSVPGQTVVAQWGESAQGMPGCSIAACRYLHGVGTGFTPGATVGVTCESNESGSWQQFSSTHSREVDAAGKVLFGETCYHGYPGQEARLVIDGVASEPIVSQ